MKAEAVPANEDNEDKNNPIVSVHDDHPDDHDQHFK